MNGLPSAAAQDIADEQAEIWSRIWVSAVRKGTTPWRQWDSANERATVIRPTVAEIRAAAATVKVRMGLGTVVLSPRAFGWLSDQVIGMVAEPMEVVEAQGLWPCQLEEAFIHLIPKMPKGARPIRFVTALPRV